MNPQQLHTTQAPPLSEAPDMPTHSAYPQNSWMGPGSTYPTTSMAGYGGYGYMDPPNGLPLPSQSMTHPAAAPHSNQPQLPQLPPLTHDHRGNFNAGHHGTLHSPHPLHPPTPTTLHSTDAPALSHLAYATTPAPNGWQSVIGNGPAGYPTFPASRTVKTQRMVSGSSSGPRKMLTDDDRRKMCIYHLQNPGLKQTDIGAKFQVERSTVSKVLRKKEKYLTAEELVQVASVAHSFNRARPKPGSPTEKSIERALTNWLKKRRDSGLDPTEEEFNHQYDIWVNVTNEYQVDPGFNLDKFKLRYKIGRRRSDVGSGNGGEARMSISVMTDPALAVEPTNVSPRNQTREPTNHSQYTPNYYDPTASQSTVTSNFDSSYTGGDSSAHPSFSGSAVTPDGNFTISPASNIGSFMPTGGDSRAYRPRTHALPGPDIEYAGGLAVHAMDSSPRPDMYSADGPGIRRMGSSGSLVDGDMDLPEARRCLDRLMAYVGGQCNVNREDLAQVYRFFENAGLRPAGSMSAAGLASIEETTEEMQSRPQE